MNMKRFGRFPVKEFWPLLFCLIAIVGMIISVTLLLIPKVSGIWERWQDLADTRENNLKMETKMKTLESVDETKMTKMLVALEKTLPSEKNALPVFAALDGLAREFVLELPPVRLTPGIFVLPPNDLQALPFPLTLRLSALRTVDVIKRLYTMNPLFVINRIHIVNLPSGQSDLEVALETYFYSLPKHFGDTTTSLKSLSDKEQKTVETIDGWVTYPELDLTSFDATVPAKRSTLFSL